MEPKGSFHPEANSQKSTSKQNWGTNCTLDRRVVSNLVVRQLHDMSVIKGASCLSEFQCVSHEAPCSTSKSIISQSTAMTRASTKHAQIRPRFAPHMHYCVHGQHIGINLDSQQLKLKSTWRVLAHNVVQGDGSCRATTHFELCTKRVAQSNPDAGRHPLQVLFCQTAKLLALSSCTNCAGPWSLVQRTASLRFSSTRFSPRVELLCWDHIRRRFGFRAAHATEAVITDPRDYTTAAISRPSS